jgi:hypothetical protein
MLVLDRFADDVTLVEVTHDDPHLITPRNVIESVSVSHHHGHIVSTVE